MRPAKTAYATADTPAPTTSDGTSWIQKPASVASTAALPTLAVSGTRTAGRMRTGTSWRRLSAVYTTPAHASPALATANPTNPSHGTRTAVSVHSSTAL